MQQETIWGSAYGDIELARQIAGTICCQQPRLDGLYQRTGIDNLLGIDAGQRVTGDVARVVVSAAIAEIQVEMGAAAALTT